MDAGDELGMSAVELAEARETVRAGITVKAPTISFCSRGG